MKSNYDIKSDDEGKPFFVATLSWVDESGESHVHKTEIIEEAETIIGLLSGNICLADLEP